MRLSVLFWFGVFAFGATSARAGFILDDFDDPAEAVSPEMSDEYVETNNVGDLNATRSIRVFSTRAPVIGRIDSAITASSALSIDLNEMGEERDRPPVVSYQFNYEITPTDLSAGGTNNALFVDFESFSASGSSPVLRLLIISPTAPPIGVSLTHTYSGSLLSEEPFTVPFLFRDLGSRGGGAVSADLSAVESIYLEMTDYSTSQDATWSGQINVVRIGAIPVPEPSGICLFLGCLTSLRVRMRSADPP